MALYNFFCKINKNCSLFQTCPPSHNHWHCFSAGNSETSNRDPNQGVSFYAVMEALPAICEEFKKNNPELATMIGGGQYFKTMALTSIPRDASCRIELTVTFTDRKTKYNY